MGGTSCRKSFIIHVMKGGWWNNQLQTSVWLLSLSLMVWQLNCLWSFLLKPTGKLTKKARDGQEQTYLFFFFTHPELAVSRHVCVYNILFCTLGFTSGIWLLSSWSSPYFVPIRMRHTCGYLLSPDIEGIWIVLSEVPSGNPPFCCSVWISLFHFSF